MALEVAGSSPVAHHSTVFKVARKDGVGVVGRGPRGASRARGLDVRVRRDIIDGLDRVEKCGVANQPTPKPLKV